MKQERLPMFKKEVEEGLSGAKRAFLGLLRYIFGTPANYTLAE